MHGCGDETREEGVFSEARLVLEKCCHNQPLICQSAFIPKAVRSLLLIPVIDYWIRMLRRSSTAGVVLYSLRTLLRYPTNHCGVSGYSLAYPVNLRVAEWTILADHRSNSQYKCVMHDLRLGSKVAEAR